MSIISAVPASTQGAVAAKPVVERESANYQPSIWGDYFLRYSSGSGDEYSANVHEAKNEIEKLVVDVKEMFKVAHHNPFHLMNLIDQVQRLGLAYKFEKEIEIGSSHIHKSFLDLKQSEDDNLYTVSLLFRLLRQQGYKISCDIFNKFTNDKGGFNESLANDVQGLLSLYEASHFRIHGEDILDEALSFTFAHLKSLDKQQTNYCLAEQVTHALSQSLRCGLTRLEARHYMKIYQEDPLHNQVLLSLAKLDFNLLQKQHQKELSGITRWWKDLDFATKLPFARDRLVECYFWILGVFFEPQYAFAREFTTKVIAITSVMDDIYDVYGTVDELEILTHAIERWDIETLYDLPEYMQLFYKALLNVYDETEETLAQQWRSYQLYYAKEAMKRLSRGYFLEAKMSNQIPTMEEYLSITLLTTGYEMLVTTCFVGMGDIATEDTFKWLLCNPKIVKASTIICRLMDDIVTREDEKERQHTGIECYMKQYDVSKDTAIKEFRKEITYAWKDINEECLRPTKMPMTLLKRIVNFACVIDVLYKNEDGYTKPGAEVKGLVISLLVDPVAP